MKLGLFGATGQTGLAVIEFAFNAGHHVTALVRDTARIPERLKPMIANIVEGDALDAVAVAKVIEGQDGIVVTLGTGTNLGPTTVMSEGLKNIVCGMKEAGVPRVSVCISAFLFMERTQVPAIFLPVTEDHERMLNVLKASDVEWVAVCPPHIEDKPATGKYKVGVECNPGRRISKHDLAEFLFKCLSVKEYVAHRVGVALEGS